MRFLTGSLFKADTPVPHAIEHPRQVREKRVMTYLQEIQEFLEGVQIIFYRLCLEDALLDCWIKPAVLLGKVGTMESGDIEGNL